MTAREVLDGIKAQQEGITSGEWKAWDRGIGYEVHSQHDEPLNIGCRETFTKADAQFIAAAPSNIRRLTAALEAVLLLASKWESRGEHDMAYSKTVQDEHIADFLLTDGATKVENARHVRNAIEGALKEGQ